uniref:Uncharacterized protein n=1 Tax=Panagrolaimus sp. ES5 TaxID=591445 RepID=A0AC34F6B2_9BILA
MAEDFTVAAIKEFSKNEKEIYGFARAYKEWGDRIFLLIYGAQSKKDVGKIVCGRNTFVMEFLKVFEDSKLKAFIFQIEGSSENVEFIRITKLNLVLTQVPFVFFNTEEQMRSSILVAANVSPAVGDRIVEVLIDESGFVVSDLEYTEKGYLERDQRDCKPYKSMTAETIRQRILGPNNPIKIMCHANLPGMEVTKFLTAKVLNNLPSSKFILLEDCLLDYDDKFVAETAKWLFDNSYTRFYVCQKSFRNYMVRVKYGDKDYPLIICKKHDILPFNQEIIIPKSYLEFTGSPFYHAYTDHNDIDVLDAGELEIPKEVHALKFTLEVDVSNFWSAQVRGIIFNKISRLSAQLDAKMFNIPVIGFYGELSFIYVKDENGKYMLLDSWNGKLGKDLYISFDEKKPKFFENAVKTFLSKKNSVCHDLIKIVSTSPSELSTALHPFGYTISSDAQNPVLIAIDNHLGEKKAASPTFLMAMLLKQHLKELKNTIGKTPNKIGFCLFDDFENKEEAKKRLEKSATQFAGITIRGII